MNYLLQDTTRPPNPPEVGLKDSKHVICIVKKSKAPLRGVGGLFRARELTGDVVVEVYSPAAYL